MGELILLAPPDMLKISRRFVICSKEPCGGKIKKGACRRWRPRTHRISVEDRSIQP